LPPPQGDPSRHYTSWDLDLFSLEPPDLYPLVWAMLSHLDLPDLFQFDHATLCRLLHALEGHMTYVQSTIL
jgi:hypothetical protein